MRPYFCAIRNGRHNFWPLSRGWGTAPPAGVDSEVVAEFVLWIEAKEATAREMTGANEGGQEQW